MCWAGYSRGIYEQAALAESWIFKGGTCLKKCYFETYRFSEDLDFTLTNPSHIDRDFLAGVFREVGEWIYERTGIEIPSELQEFEIFENPRGTVSCQGKLSYRGPISPRAGGLPRIKLDLTPDELLVLRPVKRVIFHDYSDAPAEGIAVLCYAYEEAFAEKVRAFGDRARPRDLYDVVNLYRNAEARPQAAVLHDVLEQKCAHRGLAVPELGELEAHRENLEGSWQPMLGHQLQALPSVASFWNVLPEFFAWLRTGVAPALPATYRMAAGETVLRDRTLRLPISGRAQSYPGNHPLCSGQPAVRGPRVSGDCPGGSNRIPCGEPVTATSSCTPRGPPMASIEVTESTASRARGRPDRVSFLGSRSS